MIWSVFRAAIIPHRSATTPSVPAPRFFSAVALPRPWREPCRVELHEDIARHLQVLRLAGGDAITLFDGVGGEYPARIVDTGKRHATVELTGFDPVERESPLDLTLVQALATSDKMDFIVQKAVELGVRAIQPVASERATLKLAGERAHKRAAHWQAVAQAACEQCGRNRVPVVAEVVSLEAWLSAAAQGLRLLLHPDGTANFSTAVDGSRPLSVLVGPEGGFSDSEIALATHHGLTPVRFGPRVLRSETAGLAALAALNAWHGDFR